VLGGGFGLWLGDNIAILSMVKRAHLLFLTPGPSTPSSHRMRDNPFLGQYTLKSQEIRKWRGKMMESGKYGRERYDGSLREFLVADPSQRKTTY
jgi:hypothetical protein